MVTRVKNIVVVFSKMLKTCPRSVNNFRTENLGRYFGDFWSPSLVTVCVDMDNVADSSVTPSLSGIGVRSGTIGH